MKLTYLGATILCVIGILYWPSGARLVQPLYLDGRFEDWEGRTHFNDRKMTEYDNKVYRTMLWDTNKNEQLIYFMVELHQPVPAGSSISSRLFCDINDNGDYNDAVDKYARINYRPVTADRGEVSVELYSVRGEFLFRYEGLWGEGYKDAGSRRFEFAIPLSYLNISTGQPFRFYLSDMGAAGERLPNSGDVQWWKPFPTLVRERATIINLALVWLVFLFIFHRNRIWLFYYIWGAVGLTFILILLFRGSFIEHHIENLTGIALHHSLKLFGVVSYLFDKAPGTILVFIRIDQSWTSIDINLENSGIIEVSVYLGLALFYPVFSVFKRVIVALSGAVLIFFFNFLRLMLVIPLISWGGRDFSFIAHTLAGRIFFLGLVIILCWYTFSRPALAKVRREIVENA